MPREHKVPNPRLVILFLQTLKMHRDYDASGVDALIGEANENLGYQNGIREHGVSYADMYKFIDAYRDLNGIGCEGPGLTAVEKQNTRALLNDVIERVDSLVTRHASEVLELSDWEKELEQLQENIAKRRTKLGL